jgi:uncharacterized protein YraI
MTRIACMSIMLLMASAPLAAQDVRYATSTVRMRADASAQSAVVTTVARGSRIVVRACAVQWCWVQYGNRAGYVAEQYLAKGLRIVGTSKGRYVNSRGNSVPTPLMSTTGPPAGATARCHDGSYSFSQSRSGTCSHHGGVARWL